MRLLNPALWPLWIAFLLMAVAALINLRTMQVPNRLTLNATLAGWSMGLLISVSPVVQAGGGFLSSLASSLISALLLIPFTATGGLGAGCVKMQMAFGAWVGCALSVAAACRLAVAGVIVGSVFTAAAAMVIVVLRKVRGEADGASRLFPAQVPLSLGSICGVAVPLLVG